MKNLSVVLATYNEEANIGPCLDSIKDIAEEIIIVDGSSTDNTREIAQKYGAKVFKTDNHPIFHINKQKALEKATGKWILQLDADERVSAPLRDEIKDIIEMNEQEIIFHQAKLKNKSLFERHQNLLEKRDGQIGEKEGPYAAFFVPRLNLFLGKPLRYGGVYPDGVIRLVKNGKAYLPAKSVHEQIAVNGKVGWLQNDLIHIDSPTFKRYLQRNSRYINLIRDELIESKTGKNVWQLFNYCFIKPIYWFVLTFIRHKGILDGFPGLVFSFFSSLRFPRAYWRYLNV
jgi:glycosyltransferase involved in cell wall biosynthesis